MYANEIHTLFDNVPLPKSSIKLMTSNAVKHKAIGHVETQTMQTTDCADRADCAD